MTEDEPLDPKVEAVRRKLVRLLAVSGGVMVLGFAAFIVAVVYRLNAGEGSAPQDVRGVSAAPGAPGAAVALDLPEGAEITGTAVSDHRIALTLRLPDGRRVIRVHDTGGRMVVEYVLQ